MEITKQVVTNITAMVVEGKGKLVTQSWAQLNEDLALCRYLNVDVEGAILFLRKSPLAFFTKEHLSEGEAAIHHILTNQLGMRMKTKFKDIAANAVQQFITQGEFEADGLSIYKSKMAVVDIWNYGIEDDGKVMVMLPVGTGMEANTHVGLINSLTDVLLKRYEAGRTSFFLEEPTPDA